MLNFYSYFCQFLSITFVVYWHSLSLFLPIIKVVWLESCLLIWISNPAFSKYSKPGPETESSYLRWIEDVTRDEKIGLKRFSKCQCVFSFSISALLSVLTMMTPIPMPTPPMMCSLVLNISSIAAGQLWQSRWRETGMCQQLEFLFHNEMIQQDVLMWLYVLYMWVRNPVCYRGDEDLQSLLLGADVFGGIDHGSRGAAAVQLWRGNKNTETFSYFWIKYRCQTNRFDAPI